MTWETIARKDFREAKAPRVVRLILGLLVLVTALVAYVLPIDGWSATMDGFASSASSWLVIFVPLVGVLLGYKAVAGERADGSLVLLLSLPHTRRDVLVGKLLGRGLVLAAGLAVAFVLAGALVVYPYGELSVGALVTLLAFGVLTLLLGLVFLTIAIAISASVRTELVATVGGFGAFVLLVVLWDGLLDAVEILLDETGVFGGDVPEALLFVHGTGPVKLYERLVTAFWGSGPDPVFGADAAWYANEWLALLALVGWVVVSLLVGYHRFEVTEL